MLRKLKSLFDFLSTIPYTTTMKSTFIEDCNTLLKSLPTLTGDSVRLAHRLSEAVNRLEAVVSQANAQFKAGDRFATFNRNFIENINKL